MRKIQFVVSLPCSSISVRIAEVPTLERARELALRVLAESTTHLAVDVWEGDKHLFNVGQSGRRVA